ncbi:3-oxoacyl-[acyl-carrier-protein] reductase FabG-like [Choristoneura fumiferana]|uniref:3-oxoacyl-[acyl-carrier-protein] reductase FabG-like n=1 Tax=Choristoneura fumiferana TaxID=7141 RepID=UPI003D15C198
MKNTQLIAEKEVFRESGYSDWCYRVAIVGRNETKLNNVAQQCAVHGAAPLIVRADVANEEKVKTIVKNTIEQFGQLDILVNNAGIYKLALITDPNILQTYDAVMNTNLRSVIQLTNLAAPYLTETKGNIVNVSSISSHRIFGEKYMSYALSKIGMDHFTRAAALELAASGVRVNSVNPGPVKTDILDNCGVAAPGKSDEMWEQFKDVTPLGRIGEPEEIAELIMFLASDKARSITGSIFDSDNGF